MNTSQVKAELNSWTHPGTGEVRDYVNNLNAVIGLEVSYYGTGNISSASLDGESISNSRAYLLDSLRVWRTVDGALHIGGLSRKAPLTAAEIKARVHAAL